MALYSGLLSGAVIAVVLVLVACAPRGQRARAADTLLAGLFLALMMGRALHVVLHWAYFQNHLEEIVVLRAGGLSWHGAAWGALIGCGAAAWARGLRWPRLASGLALAAPLLAVSAWIGCQQAFCSYGAEVSTLAAYPSWLVVEARDIFGLYAPRFNTQALGAAAAVGVGGVVVLLRAVLPPLQLLGLSLSLIALICFGLGYLRGDSVPMVASLRADQWLDLAVLLTGMTLMIGHRRLRISSV
jgi:phosphatidylglycerol:prolipoprotein diacylglycerol transferase